MTAPAKLSDDLLVGAPAIAEFVFGDAKRHRAVYALKATSTFPAFRFGRQLAVTKSTVIAWIRKQESRAGAGFDDEK